MKRNFIQRRPLFSCQGHLGFVRVLYCTVGLTRTYFVVRFVGFLFSARVPVLGNWDRTMNFPWNCNRISTRISSIPEEYPHRAAPATAKELSSRFGVADIPQWLGILCMYITWINIEYILKYLSTSRARGGFKSFDSHSFVSDVVSPRIPHAFIVLQRNKIVFCSPRTREQKLKQ